MSRGAALLRREAAGLRGTMANERWLTALRLSRSLCTTTRRRSHERSPRLYAEFRARFPEIIEKNEELGRLVHEQGGPLDDKVRSLVKIGIARRASSHVCEHAGRSAPAKPAPARRRSCTRSFW